jgi:hypothetical protein
MPADITFEIDPDAPPFVLGVGAVLKRSAGAPKLRARLAKMRGTLGLRSSVDRQVATVTFDRGRIAMSGRVPADADMVITLDPNDATVKPKVTGVARHLAFALNVSKVMEPPAGTWQEEADAFWAFAGHSPRMPSKLRIVCTDDNSQHILGDPSGPTSFEVHASAPALVSLFSGASILGQDALDGKINIVGSIEHTSILTGRSIAWALGDGR